MIINFSKGKFIGNIGDSIDYQNVLDNFGQAKLINILTYNISKNKEFRELVTNLADIDDNVPIRIVTSIPSWQYGSDVSAAYKKYKEILKPLLGKKNIQIKFSKDNHGKIVGTESVVYFGSANLSFNRKNIETGCIIHDSSFITELYKSFFDEIFKIAIPIEEDSIVIMTSLARQLSKIANDITDLTNSYEEVTDKIIIDITNLRDYLQKVELNNNDDFLSQISSFYEFDLENIQEKSRLLFEKSDSLDYSDCESISVYNRLVHEKIDELKKKYNQDVEAVNSSLIPEHEKTIKIDLLSREYQEKAPSEIIDSIEQTKIDWDIMEEAKELAKEEFIITNYEDFCTELFELTDILKELEYQLMYHVKNNLKTKSFPDLTS
ncbi:MAG: phospholipase D-like domain-containing protein [Streptococcus sp.]|uniref:phospholipase D-like domain-containing protein n=1 Tax=Streptococcus sp. TaxID=1306 RepID=UPI002901283C|nr:phospholipase D-like domain-containing protein [Streptococcus sp.]MDU2588345.1 phospholipase D-like domain-containing protein [Streptococcus sp.]